MAQYQLQITDTGEKLYIDGEYRWLNEHFTIVQAFLELFNDKNMFNIDLEDPFEQIKTLNYDLFARKLRIFYEGVFISERGAKYLTLANEYLKEENAPKEYIDYMKQNIDTYLLLFYFLESKMLKKAIQTWFNQHIRILKISRQQWKTLSMVVVKNLVKL